MKNWCQTVKERHLSEMAGNSLACRIFLWIADPEVIYGENNYTVCPECQQVYEYEYDNDTVQMPHCGGKSKKEE